MKKIFALGALALALVISGCGDKEAAATSGSAAQSVQTAAQEQTKPAKADEIMLLGQMANKDVVIKLADNAATQSLRSMLPAELEFKDFNNTEKIAYPPNKLNVSGAQKGHAPKAGDMCIYVPWGNICIFYHDYKFSSDLVYLGHVEQGLDALSSQSNDFNVKLAEAK
ncbi:cyclophilin-like fold protein [uncultured Phascolarctobacterium sp.]|uniref:cyclophilin-like fold protein n=1 Tax=uncultured Phascolarctobacterium sp. TaxID=512296 RepID=UPI0025E3C5BA|nr:cyclophilin-like fold protein [uncultured Phascolarctobacterium sp.]